MFHAKYCIPILAAGFLFFQCKEDKNLETRSAQTPKRFKAKPLELNADSVLHPEIVPLGLVDVRPAGKPTEKPIAINVKEVGPPTLIPNVKITVSTPGKDSLKLPEVVKAVHKPYKGKTPRPILAGDPHFREMNPAGFSSLSTKHGLPINLVFGLGQDRLGNIWFGTFGYGISKFDGKYLTNYSLAEGLPNGVGYNGFCDDNKGNMWISTNGSGLFKFDGTYFTQFTTNEGLISDWVRGVVNDASGNLWVASSNGISKYDGLNFTNYSTPQGVPATNYSDRLFIDSKGNLWFGTTQGICRFDGQSFYVYSETSSHTLFGGIVEDQQGQIWLGSNAGVLLFDGKSFWDYSKTGLPTSANDIFCDMQGNLWICHNAGINKFSPGPQGRNGTTTHFGEQEGLTDETIITGMQDTYGNYWFGTNNGGVNKYPGEIFRHYDISRIRGVSTDQSNNIWVATFGNGISKINDTSITTYSQEEGLGLNNVHTICPAADGSIWIGTYGAGIDKYDGKTFSTYSTRSGLVGNSLFSIMEDNEGNIWAGSTSGLSKFDGKTFTNFAKGDGRVLVVFQDSHNNIWIGTGLGPMKLSGNTLTQYSNFSDRALGFVAGISEDSKGTIWFTTSGGGIFSFDGNYFTQFTTDQGLSTDNITSILKTSEGDLIALSNQGLNKMSLVKDANRLPDALDINHYQYADGFIGVGGLFQSLAQDTNNIIWVGGSNKVTAFNPKAGTPDTIPPSIQVNEVLLFDQSIDWSALESTPDTTIILNNGVHLEDFYFNGVSAWYYLPQKLELAPTNNYLTFHFIGITAKNPNAVRYQYFLDGFDERWSTLGKSNEAIYNNLPHGNYVFRVKAVNTEGYWSKEMTYSFVIRPPWWLSTVAYVVYGLLLIAGIRLVHLYQKGRVIRTEQMKAQKKELEQARQIEKAYKELKATQAQLIQSEKMASLGELTAGIAHEIQNPLNFVNNFSEVNKELLAELKQEADKGNINEVKTIADNVIGNEDKINHHGKRADAIVKGMLQHSRTSSGQKEPTDINALADEYLRLAYHGLLAKDKSFNAELKTDFDLSIGIINIIPQDIGRVILNLINNAFYVVNEKSRQGIVGYEPTVEVRTKKDGNKVFISVKDNGNGIPDSIKEKIFQPFFTTKPTGQGTGLGLSLSYDIVKAHGGEIKVETVSAEAAAQAGKEGVGSEFTIQLPFA